MSRTLFGLRQSPWTERARWALDHHGLAYTYHEHLPMVGELLLRRKARPKDGQKPTVPLLADGDVTVMGSVEIARHAEKQSPGTTARLFPAEQEAAIGHWAGVAERITNVGRARYLQRLVGNKQALAESLPGFVPGGLRGVLAPSAGMAVRYLARKYDVEGDGDRAMELTARPLLEETREAIKDGGYILSRTGTGFSFADLALASTMQLLKPRAESKLGPATREMWTNEKLADEFEDLVAWRDTIYAKHR